MPESTKTKQDFELIKNIFNVEPISWARYPDGRLVFISPTGQKFAYSQELLDQLAAEKKAAAKPAAKKQAAAEEKPAAPAKKAAAKK